MYDSTESEHRNYEYMKKQQEQMEQDIIYGRNGNADYDMKRLSFLDAGKAHILAQRSGLWEQNEIGQYVRKDSYHENNATDYNYSSNHTSNYNYTPPHYNRTSSQPRSSYSSVPHGKAREDTLIEDFRDICEELASDAKKGYIPSLASTCAFSGVFAAIAGVAMLGHIPVIATTAALAVASCIFSIIKDRVSNSNLKKCHIIKNMTKHATLGLVSTAIAIPASIAGPVGPLVMGGAALGVGAIRTIFVKCKSRD